MERNSNDDENEKINTPEINSECWRCLGEEWRGQTQNLTFAGLSYSFK